MKIIKAAEMTRIEKLAYFRGASEEAFMEKAGEGVALMTRSILNELSQKGPVCFLCGRGNNGGDGFVAARLLQAIGIEVFVIAMAPLAKSSELCKKERKLFEEAGGQVIEIADVASCDFGRAQLLVDGILGTGFHGELKGLLYDVVDKANGSGIPILSIDIPSGMDGNTGVVSGVCIRARETLFLGLPKTGPFLGNAWEFTGKVHIFNFGLPESAIEAAEEDFILLNDAILASMFPRPTRTQHKYEAGYVVGIGGSFGMPGAPMLSGEAALKSGAGIVRLLHLIGMEHEFSAAPYELVRQGVAWSDYKTILDACERAHSLFIGPGIGTSSETVKLLKKVLPKLEKPTVIDAEALTLLAEHSIALPQETILTPHHGEMKRLLHLTDEPATFLEFLNLCREYAEKNKVIIVLKGAPTFIIHPLADPLVCSRGTPGMATAGSGDVLTGIIAAFLAQKARPLDAAALGVYVHAVAGECAAEQLTNYCMTARSITENLPRVFKHFTTLLGAI